MGEYPGADNSRRYDKKFPGRYAHGFPTRGVLHTTETPGLPIYKAKLANGKLGPRGSAAPHFTIDPKTGKVWQHFDTNNPARALRHRPATSIETNNASAIQIEVIAYSDVALAHQTGGLRADQLTPAQLAPISDLMHWVSDLHKIPLKSGLTFEHYTTKNNPKRLTEAEWTKFHGWCGHSHVPRNTHGDPSNIDIAALLGDTEVDDVKITKSQGTFQKAQAIGSSWSSGLLTGMDQKVPVRSMCGGPGYASGVITFHTENVTVQDTIVMRGIIVEKDKDGAWSATGSTGAVEQPGSIGDGFYQYAFGQDLQAGQRIRFEVHTTGGTKNAQIVSIGYNAAVML